MSKRRKAALFSLTYLLVFFSIAFFSMQIFGIILTSIGLIFVIDMFAKFFRRKLKFSNFISIFISILILSVSTFFLVFFLIPAITSELQNFFQFLNQFFEDRSWSILINNQFFNIEANFDAIIDDIYPKLIGVINDFMIQLPNYGKNIVIFVFYVILITLYGSFYIRNFKHNIQYIFPLSIREEAVSFIRDLYINLEKFVIVTIAASVFVGVCAFFVMSALGIKYTLLLSVWAAMTNLIPIVGVPLEFVPLSIVAVSKGLEPTIILLIALSIIHLSAFIFFLFTMRGMTRINPVAIIISILIFGFVFGYVGPLIAVPIGIVIKVYWKHFITPEFESG